MKNTKLKNIFMINIGIILLSVGIYFFKIQNGFATGGVTGIGTVLGKVTPVTPATWIWILNIVLLILGFAVLGKETGVKTVYCSMMYSALTFLFERFVPLSAPLTDQPLMELIYAMLLTSIGSAIIFNCNASSGGTDIVALILKKYTSLNVGTALLFTDFIIAATSFYVFGIKIGLFSMLGLFAKAFLVDLVIDNLNSYKYFIVITTKRDEISEYIIKTLHHGVTVSEARGEYTKEDKYMIHSVCRRIEAIRLRNRIKEIDPHSFVIITTSSEIIGRGFRSI